MKSWLDYDPSRSQRQTSHPRADVNMGIYILDSPDIDDAMRFRLSLRTVTGRRLTYKEVTGQTCRARRVQLNGTDEIQNAGI